MRVRRGVPARRERRGIALVAALALLTLITLLVVGGMASSTLAQRSSRLAGVDAVLNASAEYALNSVLAEPARYDLASVPFGERRVFSVSISGRGEVDAHVSVLRLPDGVLWLSSEATLGADGGRRRVNVVASFPSLGPDPPAGLVARGAIHLGARVVFSPDTTQTSGCETRSAPDIVATSGSDVSGANGWHVARDARAGDSTSYDLAQAQLAALAGGAGVTHVRGDTTIAGGSYEGVLIVDGTITISGSFTFTGLMVAKAGISARAGGLVVVGAMMAFTADENGESSVELQDATIRYSPCAVQHALHSALPPRPVRQRGWAELF